MDSEPLSDTPPLVSDRETAIQFIRWCVAQFGLGYHPDTAFGAYVDAQGNATFAPEDARHLDKLQSLAFEYCDPYEVGLAEFQRWVPELGMDATVKGPIIYHDPAFQRELIKTGTREQLIEWLCWNDPSGTYADRNCEIEGVAIITLDRARQIMQLQINPISSVIPRIADKAANEANIAAIDQLVRTEKYRHIVAWGKWLGFTPTTVLQLVKEAEAVDAPIDAIQKVEGRWLRVGDIQNEVNRQRVNDLAVKNWSK